MANFIAIDLEASGVYAVAGTARGSAKITHALAWTADDAEPPPALTPDTARAFGDAVRAKLKAAGVPPAPVLVAVGRDKVILKELKHPPVPPSEEPALIKFQAIKEMSESPDDMVLDYVPLGDTGEGDKRAMAVMLRKDVFNAVQLMCTAAGLKLAGVTPRPFAVAAGLARGFAAGTAPPPAHKTDAVAALTLSPGGGEFTVARSGEVVLTLAVPAPVMASETMLASQLRRNLTVYAGQHPGHPVAALYLAEVGPGWADRLAPALGVPVHPYDPLGGALPKVPEPLRGRFAGAIGLLAARTADALPINFAQPRQPTTARDPARRKVTVAALAAALLLLAVGGAGAYLRGAAADRLTELSAKKDELKERTDKGKPDVTRSGAVESWARREVVWLDELHDLADRMPPDDSVRVTELKGTPLPVGKDGKQDAQVKLELKIAAVAAAPVNGLVSAIERDNTVTNKYYTNTSTTVLGALTGGNVGRHTAGFAVITRVHHREPDKYDRVPKFTPPKRSWGAFAPAPPPEPTPQPEAAKEPAETAPAPKAPAEALPDELPPGGSQ
ncbi:MAG: hypothetical protein ACKODX_04990 [Gemmata sp.]